MPSKFGKETHDALRQSRGEKIVQGDGIGAQRIQRGVQRAEKEPEPKPNPGAET